MAYQLVINVTSSSILSSLENVLGAMKGVTIENKTKVKKKSTTEIILSDEELLASIKRGEDDIAEGRSMIVTSNDIKNMLGL